MEAKIPVLNKVHVFGKRYVQRHVQNLNLNNTHGNKNNSVSIPNFRNKKKIGASVILQWLVGSVLGTEQKTKSDNSPSNNFISQCVMISKLANTCMHM